MAKQPSMPEQLAELPWPLHGLFLSSGFASQPPGTTPIGMNVRTYEPSLMRARGGARPGLSEYITSQVQGTPTKVQHLNYVVDPTEDALTDDFSGPDAVPDDQLIPFPGYPGQFVRRGGSPKQPNKNKNKNNPPNLVGGANFEGSYSSVAPITTSFSSTIVGELLIVAVATWPATPVANPNNQTVVVQDSLGNSYIQAGTYARWNDASGGGSPANYPGGGISLWFSIAAFAGACNLIVTPTWNGGNVGITIQGLGFTGRTWTGLDAAIAGSGQSTAGTGDVGVVGVNHSDLIFGAFSANGGTSAGPAFTLGGGGVPFAGSGSSVLEYLVAKVNTDINALVGIGNVYAGVGASFY